MRLSDTIATKMASNDVISKDDRNLYAYGLRGMAMLGICAFTMFAIGILLHELLFTAVFFLSYTVLRAFYGGYHAQSRIVCFVLSNLIVVLSIAADKYIGNDRDVKTGFIVITIFIVLNIMKFIEYKKKELYSESRKLDFEKWITGIGLFLFILVLFFIMQKVNNGSVSNGIFISIICVFILHVIKKVKN